MQRATGPSVEPFVDQVPRRFFVFGRAGNPKFNFFHIVKYEVANQNLDANFKKDEKIAGARRKEKTQRLARSISIWALLRRQDDGLCANLDGLVCAATKVIKMVDPTGIEPATSSLRTRRSPR